MHLSPIQPLVEGYLENLKVEASSKMSSVLMLSLESPVQEKGKDILNKLIEVYNAAGLEDKNKVAANTLVFIDERLALISKDLTEVDKNVEEFNSREGITDISEESKLFLESVKENDAQLNQVKIQQGILNSIEQYVRNKENKTGTVPEQLADKEPERKYPDLPEKPGHYPPAIRAPECKNGKPDPHCSRQGTRLA